MLLRLSCSNLRSDVIDSVPQTPHTTHCTAADPLLMLASGNTAQVKTAVTLLAANAQVLGILSVARALSECQGVSLSNELFVQVSFNNILHLGGYVL
jgi:hypothetical protein